MKYTCSMETVQQHGRFTLFLVNSLLIYILFSLVLQIFTFDPFLLFFIYQLSFIYIYVTLNLSFLLSIYYLSIYINHIFPCPFYIFVTFYVFTWNILISTFMSSKVCNLSIDYLPIYIRLSHISMSLLFIFVTFFVLNKIYLFLPLCNLSIYLSRYM